MAKSGSERVSKGVWHPSTASRLGHCHHGEGEMYCTVKDLSPNHSQPSWPLSSWGR